MVSVVGSQLSVVTALLWDIVASRPQRFECVLRYSLFANSVLCNGVPETVGGWRNWRWPYQVSRKPPYILRPLRHVLRQCSGSPHPSIRTVLRPIGTVPLWNLTTAFPP